MPDNTSLFGLSGFDFAARAAYDMCILADEQRRLDEAEESQEPASGYPNFGMRWC